MAATAHEDHRKAGQQLAPPKLETAFGKIRDFSAMRD
jgi:hypothetical protein